LECLDQSEMRGRSSRKSRVLFVCRASAGHGEAHEPSAESSSWV
jgi:hypothetical protein